MDDYIALNTNVEDWVSVYRLKPGYTQYDNAGTEALGEFLGYARESNVLDSDGYLEDIYYIRDSIIEYEYLTIEENEYASMILVERIEDGETIGFTYFMYDDQTGNWLLDASTFMRGAIHHHENDLDLYEYWIDEETARREAKAEWENRWG